MLFSSAGLIALVFPQTFFGGKEIQILVETGSVLGLKILLLIGLAKMLTISCTLHSGFRGGFILPLFYLGAVVGFALSLEFPPLHPTISMACMMVAVNVAITKTPISATVILNVLSSTSMVPVISTACIVSFLLTTELSLIKTQRSRSGLPSESRIFTSESAPQSVPAEV